MFVQILILGRREKVKAKAKIRAKVTIKEKIRIGSLAKVEKIEKARATEARKMIRVMIQNMIKTRTLV